MYTNGDAMIQRPSINPKIESHSEILNNFCTIILICYKAAWKQVSILKTNFMQKLNLDYLAFTCLLKNQRVNVKYSHQKNDWGYS